MFFLRLGHLPLSETIGLFLTQGVEDDMISGIEQILAAASRHSCKILLALLWCIGLICGASVAACTDNLASLMLACCNAGVSIVGLFIVPFLPFLISAFAVFCSAPLILYLTGLYKSFLLGFCVSAVGLVFFGGSWLVCLLLLFTDLLTVPGLLWFQMRCLDGYSGIRRCWLWALLWFISVCIADYLWIAPLLREII